MKGMPGISSGLLSKLRQSLANYCASTFQSDQALYVVFVDQRLKSYQTGLPQANNPIERIDFLIAYLSPKSQSEKNLLITFLEVIAERQPEGDDSVYILVELAYELESELVSGVKLPSGSTPYSRLSLPDLVRNRDSVKKDLRTYTDQWLYYLRQPDSTPKKSEGIELNRQMYGETRNKLTALESEIDNYSSIATQPPKPPEQSNSPLAAHYAELLVPLLVGKVIPILGPEVNAFGRAPGSWERNSPFPPTASELAHYLANTYDCPYPLIKDNGSDLARISQYVTVMQKDGPLQNDLRSLFKPDKYEPTELHHFFAKLPQLLHAKKPDEQYPIFISAGYDDLLEQAFEQAHQPYDLVFYVSTGSLSHKLAHWPWSSDKTKYVLIKDANKYRFELEKRPLILKMQHLFDPTDLAQSQRIITEDQFINYINLTDAALLPATLLTKLKSGSLLFLGYNVSDWSLRVMLHRIWSEYWRSNNYTSWAIGSTLSGDIERNSWQKWDVKAVQASLEDYIKGLEACLNKP
jgi:hypothetical protein